jgi:ketosteroid isomerase-like protein
MLDPRKTASTILMALLLLPSAAVTQSQSPTRSSTKRATEKPEDFAAVMQEMRDSWVQEFNAGHADKVAAFYAPEAVLMRWDGTVHGYDSILAELQGSITGGAHSYIVHSLQTERSGDLGYDAGAYNVTLRDRVVEGNYLLVVKRISGQWKIVAHASVPNPQEKP